MAGIVRVAGNSGEGGSFWGSSTFKIVVVVIAALAIAAGVFFYIRYRDGKTEEMMAERLASYRLGAENFARVRAKELAEGEFDRIAAERGMGEALRSRGIRHDLGDPGVSGGLGASHSFETGIDEVASSAGYAVQSETAPIGSAEPRDVAVDLQPPSGSTPTVSV